MSEKSKNEGQVSIYLLKMFITGPVPSIDSCFVDVFPAVCSVTYFDLERRNIR